MSRFFVPPDQIHGNHFVIQGAEAHHARDVLRKKPGDLIEIFDGRDASYPARIERVGEDEIHGIVLERITKSNSAASTIHLTLVQALIKGPKWDWLVEKASEIGVSALWPVETRRSVVKSGDDPEHKLKRWNRIALEAAKQSGRDSVMTIHQPADLSSTLSRISPQSFVLIPWEKETKLSLVAACEQARLKRAPEIYLLIGPEGGWDPDEVAFVKAAGGISVRLGPTLLRSETAGLVSATLVLGQLGGYA